MPFASKAQRRWMYAAAARGEVPKDMPRRWSAHTDGGDLPEKITKDKEASVNDVVSIAEAVVASHVKKANRALLGSLLERLAGSSRGVGRAILPKAGPRLATAVGGTVIGGTGLGLGAGGIAGYRAYQSAGRSSPPGPAAEAPYPGAYGGLPYVGPPSPGKGSGTYGAARGQADRGSEARPASTPFVSVRPGAAGAGSAKPGQDDVSSAKPAGAMAGSGRPPGGPGGSRAAAASGPGSAKPDAGQPEVIGKDAGPGRGLAKLPVNAAAMPANQKLLLGLLAAGGVGLGGYGLYRALGRRKKEDKEVQASDRSLLARVVGRAVAVKRASLERESYLAVMNGFIDKVAQAMPPSSQSAVRLLQSRLASGDGLGVAIKAAYPTLGPESRGVLADRLVKAAHGWFKSAMTGCATTSPVSATGPHSQFGKMMTDVTSGHGQGKEED